MKYLLSILFALCLAQLIGQDCDLILTGFTKTDVTLIGPNTGTITLTATTSFGPITYSIKGPVIQSNNTGVFTGLPEGVYQYLVSDDAFEIDDCQILGIPFLISSPACDLNLTGVTSTDVTCLGPNTGSITLTASTTYGPITYNISGPVNQSNSTGVFTALPDGIYAFTLNDDAFQNQPCSLTGGPINIVSPICTSVPTLSQWGLIVLSIIMLLIGVITVRQKILKTA